MNDGSRESASSSPSTSVFTDGACSGNPGPGGWAIIIVQDGKKTELSGGFRTTTNNRMELQSVIVALGAVTDRKTPVIIHSDSTYIVNAINSGHAIKWQKNGWMRDRKHSAMNADLWERLLALCRDRDVRFVWVKGHDGNPDNERVDQLAVEASQRSELPADTGYENPPLFVGDSLFT